MNLILTILETSGWFATEPCSCFHGKKWEFIDDSFLGEPLVWSVDLSWFKHRDMVNIRLIVFETIRLIAQKHSFGTPDSFYWDGLRTCHPSLLGMVLQLAPDKIHVESGALKLTWRTRFSSLPMTSENEWRQNFKQHLSWWCSSERSIAKLEFPLGGATAMALGCRLCRFQCCRFVCQRATHT